ncbi:MAG: PAS domain S-box protein [Aminivibrio sp.]|nr:PAS domain S-box protein [Aminivibrio sp.]
MKRKLCFHLGIAFMALFLLVFSRSASGSERSYAALLLNSYHSGFPWTDGITEGIRSTFASGGLRVNLDVEYMDTKRASSVRSVRAFGEYFRTKYAEKRPDILLCSDDDALVFLLRHGRELFPGVPVVFCGLNNPGFVESGGDGHVTGVFEEMDIPGTVELIFRLFPGTRNLALVSDLSISGMGSVSLARKALAPFLDRLKVVDLLGFSGEELRDELSKLPPDTAVLLLVYFQDEAGDYYSPARSVALVNSAGPFPVFGLWSMMVQGGALGGSVLIAERHGALAAELAIRILQGTPVSEIPPVKDHHLVPVFNYMEMVRFGLSRFDLPAGSVLLSEPETFLYSHWKILLANALVISAVLVYLLVLFINERMKKAAEKDLELKKAQWEGLFRNAPEAYVVFDGANDVVTVNEGFTRLFGYTREEAAGKNLDSVVADFPGLRSEAEKISSRVLSGEVVTGETYRRKKDGTLFPAEILGVVFPMRDETFTGFAIYRDISERKKAEDEMLKNLKREALISSVSARLLEDGIRGGVPPSLEDLAAFLRVSEGCLVETDGGGLPLREFSLTGGRVEFLSPAAVSTVLSPETLKMLDLYLWEKGKLLLEASGSGGNEVPVFAGELLQVWGTPLHIQPVYSGGAARGFLALRLHGVPLPHSDEALLAMYCDLAGSAFLRERRKDSMEEVSRMLDSASRGIVEILGHALAMKDPYTVGHQINVANLARAMAKKGGYDEAFQERVYYAGLVHDLGKITIPSAILSKPGKLTDIEFSLIRNHALYGWDILSSVDLPWPLADIVVQHHERLDGSGYPKGLRGDAIGREARFLSVADVVEAMTSHRPYRPGLGIGAALDEIRFHRGGWFDPEAVDLCIAVIEEGFAFDGGSYRLFLP